ncbi:hypothetical protein QUC31_006390, partial [Theobroma cacao]
VMAVSELSRLRTFLEMENVPVRRLIVNQILHPSASDCKFCAVKRKFPHNTGSGIFDSMKVTVHKQNILQSYKSSIREARDFDIKLPEA